MICEAIKNVKPDMSVIPAFASLNESAYYIIEANEKDFTEMIKSIGLHELGVFEATGSVLLYETDSEEKKEDDEKKEGFLVKIWARIKAVFEKFLTKIKEKCAQVSSLLVNSKIRGKDIEANIDKLPDDFKYERYPYTKLYEALKASNPDNLLRARANTNSETTKNMIDKYTNSNSNDADEIRKEIRGEKKETLYKADLKNNINKIMTVVTDYNNASAAIKNFYKNTQNYFDKLIKDAKDQDTNKVFLNDMKMKANKTVLYANILLSEYYSLYMENVKLVLKLAKIKDTTSDKSEEKKEEVKPEEKKEEAKGKEKVEVQHNSAFDSELSSLFDWTY